MAQRVRVLAIQTDSWDIQCLIYMTGKRKRTPSNCPFSSTQALWHKHVHEHEIKYNKKGELTDVEFAVHTYTHVPHMR